MSGRELSARLLAQTAPFDPLMLYGRRARSIWGTLEGGVLLFDWVQLGDLNEGRRDVSGKGYLVISDDGSQLAGRWGYGESRTNGGEWTADKAMEDYGHLGWANPWL